MIARGTRGPSGLDPIVLIAVVLLIFYAFTGSLYPPISAVLRNPASPQAWLAFISFGVAVLLGITVHEFMHAYMANRHGDDTARLLGRLSLNPLAHFDLFGTLLLVVAGFGYGKPVPFNESRLRGAFGVTLMALAGPLANLALAAVCAVPLRFAALLPAEYVQVLEAIVVINCVLFVFNLLPIPPLDGANVVYGLLSPAQRWAWRSYQQYGPMLLLLLLLLGGRLLFTIVFGPAQFLAGLLVGARF